MNIISISKSRHERTTTFSSLRLYRENCLFSLLASGIIVALHGVSAMYRQKRQDYSSLHNRAKVITYHSYPLLKHR